MPKGDTRLRFLLKAKSRFIHTTVVEQPAKDHAYHFSNRVNAGTGMFISRNAGEVDSNDLDNGFDVDPRESFLGVIDVFTSNAMNSNYELFANAMGELRKPEYRIQFRSSF